MKKITIILSLLVSFSSINHAQDIHFTSFDYSSLTLNPGLAGVNNDIQATAIYRNQWNAVAQPFQTISANFDMRIGKDNPEKKGFVAVGAHFFNDNSGVNRIVTNSGALTGAYHIKLAPQHYFGLGVQWGFGGRSIRINDGKWVDQHDGNQYDPSIPSGETFNSPSFYYFDVSSGFVYSYHSEDHSSNNEGLKITAGLGIFHINKPGYSFIDKHTEKLYMRSSIFARAQIGIGEEKFALEPQLMAQFQGPAMETIIGTDVRTFIGKGQARSNHFDGTSAAIGVYWRNKDALMTRLSVRAYNFDIGLAYDFNLFSDLKNVSRYKGAVEIFLKYVITSPFEKSKERI